MRKNPWNAYIVKFWNHQQSSGSYEHPKLGTVTPYLNDCTGNTISKTVRARSEKEAIKRVKKENKTFRLHSVLWV